MLHKGGLRFTSHTLLSLNHISKQPQSKETRGNTQTGQSARQAKIMVGCYLYQASWSILYCFSQVVCLDNSSILQVGDGAGKLEDAVEGSGRER
jgi:hypothetical protein